MSEDEIKDVIFQAKNLGVKKVVILGGEPMIYPSIIPMVRYIHSLGLSIEMFTNGCNISVENARELFMNEVNVVLKMNTFDEKLQDEIAGKKGAFSDIQNALKNLQSQGYPSKNVSLGASTVLCSQNIHEIKDMWRWLRERGIRPYFETITPQGNAKKNNAIDIDPIEAFKLFSEISEIDKNEYGYDWQPQPPLVGNKCLRNQYSCLITANGNVFPCVGVTIPLGNVRTQSLSEIIAESEVLEDLRNYKTRIKGPCRECSSISECYGCRGAAYQLTGDYMASDPLCWNNSHKIGEIQHLPMAVDALIPQKLGMKVIDRLEKVSEREAETSAFIKNDMVFINDDGTIDEVVYIEMIAQTIAAREGFRVMGNNEKIEGFLLGIKDFKVYSKAYVGDILRINVKKRVRYGDFGIVKGVISNGNETIAEGEVKVWQKKS